MKLRFACAALLLGITLPAVAPAQTGLNELTRNVRAPDKNFGAADKNHDGMLTRQEARAVPFVDKNFDAIDAKSRGSVSKKDVHDYIARALKSTSNKTAPVAPSASHP